jgi:hypothetical protein
VVCSRFNELLLREDWFKLCPSEGETSAFLVSYRWSLVLPMTCAMFKILAASSLLANLSLRTELGAAFLFARSLGSSSLISWPSFMASMEKYTFRSSAVRKEYFYRFH